MYSPKIEESLIPVLYHTAQSRRVPMTRLVSQLIRKALKAETLPQAASEALALAAQKECEVVLEVRTTYPASAGHRGGDVWREEKQQNKGEMQ